MYFKKDSNRSWPCWPQEPNAESPQSGRERDDSCTLAAMHKWKLNISSLYVLSISRLACYRGASTFPLELRFASSRSKRAFSSSFLRLAQTWHQASLYAILQQPSSRAQLTSSSGPQFEGPAADVTALANFLAAHKPSTNAHSEDGWYW